MTRWILLLLTCAAVVALGVVVGPAPLALTDVWDGLWGIGDNATVAIVRELRVPRVVLAFLVGGCLAATGAALQALVRNPLADPYLLGLSGGAGLGAVGAIALGVGASWGVPLAALAGALLAIALVYRVALIAGAVLDTRVLLLGGVVVGAFAASIMGAIMALSPAPEVRNALMWLLGSFERASWQSVAVFTAYAVFPLGVLYAYARDLDLLSLGEEPAHYLGSNVERAKRVLYVTASLLTAVAVSFAGIIGFVGLVIPHAVRLTWGHLHRALLPAGFLLGGILMVFADVIARTAFTPVELPVGVVTALIGVPIFILLVRRWAS